jgi:DNA-binding NarL/FixJ family response regulator
MSDKKIRIGIAEDYELERDGIIALLKETSNFEITIAASNGQELLAKVSEIPVDIILLDIEMKVMDGRETFTRLRKKYPNIKVIMLTEHFSDSYITEFISGGARAFLSKNNKIEKVKETINQVNEHGYSFDSIVGSIISKKDLRINVSTEIKKKFNFTKRELEIMKLMCIGKENKEISELLFIDIRTIEGHRSKIWSKSGCKNLVELMVFAFKHNLISF